MEDALVQDDGIDLIAAELDQCWEVTQDQDKASKIANSEGRQNGNYLHVLRGAEEAQFSTAGECAGYATACSGQGLRDTTRRETQRKQLR